MITTKISSTAGQIIKNDPKLAAFLKEGELVSGTIIAKNRKGVFLDLGRHGTGIIYGIELINSRSQIKGLNVGDAVTAKIVDPENDEGYAELSLAEAGKQKIWEDLKEQKEKDEPINVEITGANYGGLMTEVGGAKAFLPVSQLSSEHYPRVSDADRGKILEELKKFVGQTLTVKIIDLNPRSEKLIVSEREAASENIKELLSRYQVGDAIDGTVSGVADFGAFVRFTDSPEIEGLVHISEIDHRLIENPKEAVSVGDAVKARITDIKDGRVALSLKALKPNPWDKAGEKYKTGDVVPGKVARFNPFGAFVNLDSELGGMIHVSEFGGLAEMKEKLAVGESYRFLIDSLKPQEKRIILKLAKS